MLCFYLLFYDNNIISHVVAVFLLYDSKEESCKTDESGDTTNQLPAYIARVERPVSLPGWAI